MDRNWVIVLLFTLVGLGALLAGCDRTDFGSEMMGNGMMRQMHSSNSNQNLADNQSEEAQLFRHFCGGCHTPPDPGVHTARDWPEVVARMHQLMATQGKPLPNQAQLGEIMNYLQQHAK